MGYYVWSVDELFDFQPDFLRGVDVVLAHLARVRELREKGKAIGAGIHQVEDLEALTISCFFCRQTFLDLMRQTQARLCVALRTNGHPALQHFAELVEKGQIAPFRGLEVGK